MKLNRLGQKTTVRAKLYSLYVLFLAFLFLVPACIAVFVLPVVRWRWTAGHLALRMMMFCSHIELTVVGSNFIDAEPAAVIAANHASFIDGLVLTASFSTPVAFVIAEEFEHRPFIGGVLRGINAQFVRRGNPLQAAIDARRVIAWIVKGNRVVFFPEGTLDPRIGVRPFYLGAFVAAARTGAPVLPVGIAGTRSILEPGELCLHPGRIVVNVGAPISPTGHEKSQVTQLCERTYKEVVRLCGEPALGDSAPGSSGTGRD